MLGGSPTSSFTLFTASTASPSDAPGARLNESVITGNCPWWFTVMGAERYSTCVNALSGTCPPVGNTDEDAIVPPVRLLVGIALPAAVLEAAELAAVAAALEEFVGPCDSAAEADPPATSPRAVPDAPLPVRMNRSRKSNG